MNHARPMAVQLIYVLFPVFLGPSSRGENPLSAGAGLLEGNPGQPNMGRFV